MPKFNITTVHEMVEAYEVEAETEQEALEIVLAGEVDSTGWHYGEYQGAYLEEQKVENGTTYTTARQIDGITS